jgi:glycosyltransferase involved in cell wall biosynthesis
MRSGIKVISCLDNTGYGQAGLAYVRALVDAGVPVLWAPLVNTPIGYGLAALDDAAAASLAIPILASAATEPGLADLPLLVRATHEPIAYDTVITHIMPHYWAELFEPGKRNVGMTVWETDALRPEWPAQLNRMERILVPCELNRATFVADGVTRPVHVVPHIRRHYWHAVRPREIAQFRQRHRIPDDHYVFYSINVWSHRKNFAGLVEAYCRAFDAQDKVTLVLKTGPKGMGPAPLHEMLPVPRMVAALVAAHGRGAGAPRIVTIADSDLPARELDLIHYAGDCFVSLPFGEGWGLGAFDAMTLARPVVMTGWGGHVDYLGADWPGLVDYRLATVTPSPLQEEFEPPQRWAIPDLDDAARRMRWAFEARAESVAASSRVRDELVARYAEPMVARTLIEALDA